VIRENVMTAIYYGAPWRLRCGRLG
jgi:hypothetical protein